MTIVRFLAVLTQYVQLWSRYATDPMVLTTFVLYGFKIYTSITIVMPIIVSESLL